MMLASMRKLRPSNTAADRIDEAIPETELEKSAFVEHMAHKVPEVNEQARNGLKVVKRTAKYMQEACRCVDISKDPAKATKDVKLSEVHSDTMKHFAQASTVCMESISNNVSLHQKMIRNVQKSVVEPLQNFYEPKNLARRHLEKKHSSVVESLKRIEKEVEQERNDCRKQYEALLDAKRLRNEETPADKSNHKFMAMQKKYHKEKSKTIECFKRFDRHLNQANNQRARHLRKDIPEVVVKLESTERERLDLMLKHFTLYVEEQEKYLDALRRQQDVLKRALAACSIEKQMEECLTNWKARFGGPPEYEPLLYDLPVTADDIQNNRFGPDYHPGMSPEQSIRRVDETEYSVSALDTSRRYSEFQFNDNGDSKDDLSHLPRCLALYAYTPNTQDEDAPQLTFQKGDVIFITEQGDGGEDDDGWWEGRLGDQIGYFPKDFVQMILDA